MTLAEVARELDVSPATLRRWAREGLVPLADGRWTPARSPTRGSSPGCARAGTRWTRSGRRRSRAGSPTASCEDLFPPPRRTYSLEQAAEQSGLEPALLERIWTAVGFRRRRASEITEEDLQLLRYIAAALRRRLPARRVPPARARLRPGAGADRRRRGAALPPLRPRAADARRRRHLEMAEEMEGLARELLPLASPIMDHVHQRFLQHFLDQDIVGHMELEVDAGERARPRPPARGDRVRRPRRLHAADRGGGGGGGGRHHRALRRGGRRTRCPTTRA